MRRSLLLAAAFFTSATASAQAIRPEHAVSLRKAVALALEGNPTLGASMADVAVADGGVTAARGLDDLVLDASASWVQRRRELVSGVPVQQPSFDGVTGSVSLTKPLPTGGRVGLRTTADYSRTGFATTLEGSTGQGQFDRQSSEVYAPSAQLVLQHSLLRGLGVDVARAERRRAAARRDFAGLTRDAVTSTLLRDVVVAYADLALATDELKIRRSSTDWAREQLQRVDADIEVGKQPPSASAEVEVVIARREDLVLIAEQSMIERSLELERLAGQAKDRAVVTFVASETLPEPQAIPVLDRAMDAALAKNPQLIALESQGRAAAIEVDVSRSSLLPQLDLTLSGGPVGNAGDAQSALRELTGFRGYVVGADLVFQEPIGRHAASGANASARAAVRRADLRADELRQLVATAVVRGVSAVEIARRRVAVLGKSEDAAALDLAAEKARFDTGRSTNFDVLRRQDDLAQVKLSTLRARADYMKAFAGVESLTGEILQHYGVSVR